MEQKQLGKQSLEATPKPEMPQLKMNSTWEAVKCDVLGLSEEEDKGVSRSWGGGGGATKEMALSGENTGSQSGKEERRTLKAKREFKRSRERWAKNIQYVQD